MTTETDAAEAVADDTLLVDDNADQQDTQPADDAGADTVEAGEGAPPAPKRQTAQERIDELTRDKHAERRRVEALEREIETLRPKPALAAAEQPKADARPDPAEYQFGETDPEFIEALGAFAARQEFRRLRAEDETTTQVRTAQQADQDRRAEFAKAHPDFHDKLASNWTCTPVMGDALTTSEHGPAVAYHLANNPDEAARIAKLDPVAQIRAIGAIEGRLSAALPAAVVPATKTASDAPPVPPTIRGAGGKFKAAADTDDFAAFDAAYDKS